MSFRPRVSLVIVSRNRPAGLERLIASLRFQSYTNFEVVVVSNHKDTQFLNGLPCSENIRHIYFDQANISAARNLGIAQSSGTVIAFCDDDAVPEPFWLARLIAPFEEPDVGSAGGFVRGRNGIDFQWKAIKCDLYGDDFPLTLTSETDPQTFTFDSTCFTKVQGTNCAFRRTALVQIGGFDENYRFFLDETDVSLCLAQKGWTTVIVPLAEVQHGFEESAERTRSRVPRTLKNIGISKAHFIAKHAQGNGQESLMNFRADQHKRLLKLMVDGFLTPENVTQLMATLDQGLATKINPSATKSDLIADDPPNFQPFGIEERKTPPEFIALAGSASVFQRLARMAVRSQRENCIVTVFRFSYTSLFHKRYFDVRGFWVQRGGLFGRSSRTGRMVLVQSLRRRANMEMRTLSTQRPFTKLRIIRTFQIFGLFSPD